MSTVRNNVGGAFDSSNFWTPNLDTATDVRFENPTSATGDPLFGERTVTYQKLVFENDGITYTYYGEWELTVDRGLVVGSVSSSGTYYLVTLQSGGATTAKYSGESLPVDFGSAENIPVAELGNDALGALLAPENGGTGAYDNLNTDATPDLPAVAYAGNDDMSGNVGADVLAGFGGNDKLRGKDGADTLIGGFGKDSLAGGNGTDTFVFNAASETNVGAGRDVISDLAISDTIDVSAIDANSSVAGNQDFVFVGEGSANREVAQGEIKYYHYLGNTFLVGNSDGDGQADFQIELRGIHEISASQLDGIDLLV